jgi:menaquinol-cytochrome c reductase iron-sulfur subunit
MAHDADDKNQALVEASEQAPSPDRRSFLATALGAVMTVAGALLAIPLVRFALYPIFAKSDDADWSDVGPASDFASLSDPVQKMVTISQIDGWRESLSQKAVYVTKDSQGQLEVLSAICPHLGCQVPWNAEKKAFYCPCHGSVFAPDGSRVSGPTPRGLDSLQSTVQDGRLKVRYEYFRQLLPDKEPVS